MDGIGAGTFDGIRDLITVNTPMSYSNGGSENPFITYGGHTSKVVDLRR